jgi:hypothetical protein
VTSGNGGNASSRRASSRRRACCSLNARSDSSGLPPRTTSASAPRAGHAGSRAAAARQPRQHQLAWGPECRVGRGAAVTTRSPARRRGGSLRSSGAPCQSCERESEAERRADPRRWPVAWRQSRPPRSPPGSAAWAGGGCHGRRLARVIDADTPTVRARNAKKVARPTVVSAPSAVLSIDCDTPSVETCHKIGPPARPVRATAAAARLSRRRAPASRGDGDDTWAARRS